MQAVEEYKDSDAFEIDTTATIGRAYNLGFNDCHELQELRPGFNQ